MSSNMQQPSIPYVTILMPLYNGIEFLHESLRSINNQQHVYEQLSKVPSHNHTWHWELIIGINGYQPNSIVLKQAQVIVESQNALLPTTCQKVVVRIVDLHFLLPHRGKSIALNAMMEKYVHPNCVWVGLCDVDDIWEPAKLSTQLKLLTHPLVQSHPTKIDVLGTQCVYFGDPQKAGISPNIPFYETINRHNFFDGNPLINSSVLMRKELAWWDPSEDGVEDYGLWLRLFLRSAPNKVYFYNIPAPLVKHRLHNESAFNSKQGNNHNKVPDLIRKYQQHNQQPTTLWQRDKERHKQLFMVFG